MPLAALPEDDVEFVLTARRWCTPVVAELTLEVAEHPIAFTAGQYFLLQDLARTVPVRSYSAASAPRPDGCLTSLVTAVDGGPTSTWLTSGASIGSRLLASGPYGTFVADAAHTGPTLYLAGGSGLAPARSLIEAAVAQAARDGGDRMPRHTLLFSGRTSSDVIDASPLSELTHTHPWLEYVRTLTRAPAGSAPPPLGHIPEVLPSLLPNLSAHAVYVSGSPGFVEACTRAAVALGAAPGRLHTEEFYAEPVPWSSAPTPTPHSPSQEPR